MNWYRSLQLFSDTTQAFAGMKLEQPAFFIWGAVDGITLTRHFDEASLRSEVPTLRGAVRVPDPGHWPHREAPEVVNKLLVDFLNDVNRKA